MVDGTKSEDFKNKKSEYNLKDSVTYTVNKSEGHEPATFETAVSATGFGKFNVVLILLILPPTFSQVFETVTMSYVLPIAQCDLNLTLEDKGMLNAITFAGMITSGFAWGYLCDAMGRKKIMVVGYLLDGFFVLMASLSQNFNMLLVAKFFGGFIINGPFSAATSYLSEFHSSEYRARVHIARGVIVSLGAIILPLLAWGILPQNLNFTLLNYFDLHSWNVFLFICSLAPISSGIIYIFMPESPKFLMSVGKNEEALRIFQKIYGYNTGKPIDTYPVKYLIDETLQNGKKITEKREKSILKTLVIEGLHQIKPLFCRPYIFKLMHVCANAFLVLMSINTLKLWFPQLFQAINDYKFTHNGASSTMCEMLEMLHQKNATKAACVVNLDNSSVYINAIIVGTTQILVFGVAGMLVNILGKKLLTVTMAIIAGCCAISIYFAEDSATVLTLYTIFLSFGGVCGNILVTITLELFPTTLRAMALSLYLMFARSGTIVGNMLFPMLLSSGCLPPFLFFGLVIFGSAGLTVLYPNTENKALS